MNLLSRLRDHFDEVMGFALHKDIPFTNNQAERDLRMLKVKEKISGCFRGKSSLKDFLRLRSFLSTMKKQQLPLLESLYLIQVLDV
jgi:transposase